MPRISTFAYLFMIALALSPVALADTINVPGDADTISDAIENADDNDTIFVEPGTYKENIDTDGKAISIESDPARDRPIIEGVDADAPVVTITQGEGRNTKIIGFNIRKGTTTGDGGGILIRDSSPVIENCLIHNNRADFDGGGVYVSGSFADPKFVNCSIRKNVAGRYGGGMAVDDDAEASIEGCTFQRNAVANSTLARSGGGLAALDGFCNLVGCHFNKNVAEGNGGGIYASTDFTTGYSIKIDNCVLKGNHASNGGGIFVSDHIDIVMKYCNIKDNVATYDGGGINLFKSTTNQIRHCDIKKNDAYAQGGGIYVYKKNSTLNFCVITNNFSNSGGGIVTDQAKATVRDSRVCNNEGGNTKGKVKAKSNSTICSD